MNWIFWIAGMTIIFTSKGENDLVIGSLWVIIGYLSYISDKLSKGGK